MLYPAVEAFSHPLGRPAFYMVIARRDFRDTVSAAERAADRLEGWGYSVTTFDFDSGAGNLDHLVDTDESRQAIQGALDFLAETLVHE